MPSTRCDICNKGQPRRHKFGLLCRRCYSDRKIVTMFRLFSYIIEHNKVPIGNSTIGTSCEYHFGKVPIKVIKTNEYLEFVDMHINAMTGIKYKRPYGWFGIYQKKEDGKIQRYEKS